jgi:regulatory protein
MPPRPPRPLDADGLFQYALRLLGSRAQSSGEVREKLRRKAADTREVEGVLGRLKDLGYLNDARFAESFTAARLENQGFGRGRVLRDLGQRRVAPALAAKVVGKAFEGLDETRLIEDYLERKFRGKRLSDWLAEEKNLASAFRRLRTAGFSAGNSIRVLKRYAARAEELESLDEPEESV